MIPKILHTGFFGHWEWTPLNLRCFASWDRVFAGWKRMHWTPEFFPVRALQHPWMIDATKALRDGKPINGTDLNFGAYLARWILNEYGGVMLNNDVEVLKMPDLSHDYILGWDGRRQVCDAFVASAKGHVLNRRLMEYIAAQPVNAFPPKLGPALITEVLTLHHGLKASQQTDQALSDGIMVYRPEILYPFAWDEKPSRERVTENTVAIHWWEASWQPELRNPILTNEFTD